MKILETKLYNNGYGCSCCRDDHKITNWIDEQNMLSIEDLLNLIYEWKFEDENCCGIKYEKESKILYGFEIIINVKGIYETHFLIGDKKINFPFTIKDNKIHYDPVIEKEILYSLT